MKIGTFFLVLTIGCTVVGHEVAPWPRWQSGPPIW